MVAHQVHTLKARFESSDRKVSSINLHVVRLDNQLIIQIASKFLYPCTQNLTYKQNQKGDKYE